MLILKGHTKSVQTLAYTPDGQTLISAGDDCTIRLWDPQTGKVRQILTDHEQPVVSLAVSPDGAQLASGGFDKDLRVWNFSSGVAEVIFTFDFAITAIVYSPDGRWLVTGADMSRSYRERHPQSDHPVLRLIPLLDGDNWTPRQWREDPPGVWALGFSPDGATLAVGQNNGAVILWNIQERHDGDEALLHPSGVFALAFSPDGRSLATLEGRTVRLWDVKTKVERLRLAEHAERAWSLAFTPDGRHLATGGWDSTVRLSDPATGREQARYDWQIGRVNAVAFSPDGMTAAAAGDAHEIIVWDVDDI
jgi:WD40 repeat protein